MWSLDHQHHLGTFRNASSQAPSHMGSRNLQGRAQDSVFLTSPPVDSDAWSSLRTGLEGKKKS